MDLEKAYNKIDNLCCINSIRDGYFDASKETQDDDFCKDVPEMIEALETIKTVVDLQKEVCCPLEIRERALKQCEFEGLYFETTDTDGFERVGVYKCCLGYDAFNNKFYWNCGWNAETWLDCYKKTWWLKSDRSE